jgi:catechol 2,3-dioxygenase-like lactoylglutathione lyase family enzyme
VTDVQRIDFVALPVEDLSRADAFYGETLGLARNPNTSGERWVEFETGNLTLALSTFGGSIALGVPNVETTRRELEQQDVRFAMDTFDSGVCHGAPFSDPDGNPLQLHHRYKPLGRYDVHEQEVRRTDYIGVNVRSRDSASAFYGGTLGLRRNPRAADAWPEFEVQNVGLVLSTPEQRGEHEHRAAYGIALRVDDVQQSMNRLRDRGVKFEFPEPYDSGVCHMAFFRDPDGNSLLLHRRYAPYSDGTEP